MYCKRCGKELENDNCRAHNLTDAINLYEEQMYRWKMENYQYYQCVMSAQKGAVKVVVY